MYVELDGDIDISPEQLAEEFCNMSCHQQARFFNAVHEVTKDWTVVGFVMQLQGVIDSPEFTAEARSVMKLIGDYGNA